MMKETKDSPVLNAIFQRRSIREYTADPIAMEQLRQIVEAGIWAPSGLNNQPWRFVLVRNHGIRHKLAELTRYNHIVEAAQGLIAVFLDTELIYDEVKDHQSAGACIQNILLATEALGLGGVWLGQILKNKNQVNEVLELPDTLDLMAVIAVGYRRQNNQHSKRKQLSEFIIKEIEEVHHETDQPEKQ